MRTIRKSIAVILILALCLSILSVSALAATPGLHNFTDKRVYTEGHFTDIGGKWFEGSVARGYSLGLIDGKGQGIYDYKGNVTLAEAIKLAACLHSIYTTGEANFTQGAPWYQVYVDYCLTKGILTSGYTDYKAAATRAQFAQIFAKAMPTAALPVINTVEDNAIPDVKIGDGCAEAVYKLYRAGILTGSDDKGTFNPNSNIQRSEMATIVTRMADPDLRKEVTLTAPQGGGAMNAEQIYAKCASAVFYIEIYDRYGNTLGSGSGVFISPDGKALTNQHVVEDAYSAMVMTTDGRTYNVKGWYDAKESIDLALIQVEGSGFNYLQAGDVSSLAGGQNIFTIGSPLGLDNTISTGIISNPNRVIDGLGYIQISAPISHGSSGGALINDKGQLIGITASGFESGQNLNLAVPINRAGELDSSTLHSFPISGDEGGYGAYLSFDDYFLVSEGDSGYVTITVECGSFEDSYYLQYDFIGADIVSASWGEWYSGNLIDLSITGLETGSTSLLISMLDSATDEVLCTSTLYVEVESTSSYYSGYYPVPDMGAVTGTPCYYYESGCYYYRYSDMPSGALDKYGEALYAAGFEFWKEKTDSYGDPVLYYTYDALDLYVYIAINYIDGYVCVEVCPYYGWEV